MKKGLKKALTVLKIAFVLSALLGIAAFVYIVIDINTGQYTEFVGMYIAGYLCKWIIAEIVSSILMIICLHIIVKHDSHTTHVGSALNKVGFGTAVATNLVYYTAFYLLFIMNKNMNTTIGDLITIYVKDTVPVPLYISVGWSCVVLWTICIITCIISLVVAAVINVKNKRMLKAATIQGEPTVDGPDRQLS